MPRTLPLRPLVAIVSSALLLASCEPAPVAAPLPRPVRVATVTLEPSAPAARYAAVVRPRIEADLGFRINGKLVQRLVEVGQRVTAGQALARLDPIDLELQVKATEAQLASARADAANAEADWRRAASLKGGGWTSGQSYDRAKATHERAQARLTELQASLAVLRNNKAYAVLTADADGVVTAVLAEPGQVLDVGQPAIRLARLGEMEVEADIPEHQTAALAGNRLSVEAWSLPGVTIAASLREMAPAADPVTRTYRVRATLTAAPAELQLGMTATLIATPPHSIAVARIPLTAVTQQGDRPAVWIIADSEDRVELRPIEIAAFAGDWAIVRTGLGGGERIVTAGAHKLDAGQRIRIWRDPS